MRMLMMIKRGMRVERERLRLGLMLINIKITTWIHVVAAVHPSIVVANVDGGLMRKVTSENRIELVVGQALSG